MSKLIKSVDVTETFKSYPPTFRKKLTTLRKLIIETAEDMPEIGRLLETVKWGEPSYVPNRKNVGTPIRIHWSESKPDQCGMYFHCQTKMIATIKKKFGNKFSYENNRALIFKIDDELPLKELKVCISLALTYHLSRRGPASDN